jgi:hypothetical protein
MESETFRSRLAQGLAVLTALVAVVALVTFVSEDGPTAVLTTLAPVTLVGVLGWAVFWNPRAEISEHGITIVNVWRTIEIPWRRFKAADSKWALAVTTTEGRTFTSWAVPAGSGFGARMAPNRRQQGGWAPAERKLGSTGTAEAAALAIAQRVRERPKPDGGGAAVTATVNTRLLAVVAGLAVLSVLSVALA